MDNIEIFFTTVLTWLVFLLLGMSITYDNDDKLANSP